MTEIYLGNPPAHIKTWIETHSEQEDSELKMPLCFTAEEPNAVIQCILDDEIYSGILQYSFDNQTWTQFWNENTTLTNIGDKLYLKLDPSAPQGEGACNVRFNISNGKIAASGNIESVYHSNFDEMQLNEYHTAFQDVFKNCTALTTAPLFPATELDCKSAYWGAFEGCTSLIKAPVLPAITLTDNCYQQMFDNCKKLSSINVSFTDWNSGINATENWVRNIGIEATGTKTFTCPAALPQTRGNTNIPEGWTIITK